ncbi:hypothetical protein F4861DRAFT_549572 [Xylaria intraflava]|nr:hypothetical protein F4861DRAFT_549572 [Xylaria intraflava]
MAYNGNPEAQYYNHPNSLTSGFPDQQPSSSLQAPSARVAGTRRQPREFHKPAGTSHSDEKMKKYNRGCPPSVGWLSEGPTTKAKQNLVADEAGIKQPASKQVPHRIRPCIERISGPILLNPRERPGGAPPFEPPVIDPRNLGSAREALHSHPIRQVSLTKRRILEGNQDTKNQNRKVVVCEKDDDSIVLISPRPPEDVLAKRRQGRIFPAHTRETMLREAERQDSPGPAGRETKHEEKKVGKSPERVIPAIEVSPPSDDETHQADPGLLSVDDVYKSLYNEYKRENRSLARDVRRLQPLAWLVSEAESININDTAALAEALRGIIEDRQMLMKILPLAITLCADQGIEFNDAAFEALPEALDKVLHDRERARHAAAHHIRAKYILRSRVDQLESELLELKSERRNGKENIHGRTTA